MRAPRGTRRLFAALAVALVAAHAALFVSPAPATPGGRLVRPIGVRTETLIDDARPTAASAALGLAATPSRTLPVTVWYPARGALQPDPVPDAPPARGQRFPLIVWAHGNGARGSAAPAVVRAWASLGYVVVAPDFPVSSLARTNLDAIDDWNAQPGDVDFVIDEMLHGAGIAGIGRVVDRAHVGVAGHSLGAMTALAVGFGAHADRRVDAIVSFTGVPLLDGSDVGTRPLPLLLVHGEDDPTIPVSQSRAMFADAAGPHFLVTVVGGGHSAYLQSPDPDTEKTLMTATVAFWDAALRGGPDPADRIAALPVPGRVAVEVAP